MLDPDIQESYQRKPEFGNCPEASYLCVGDQKATKMEVEIDSNDAVKCYYDAIKRGGYLADGRQIVWIQYRTGLGAFVWVNRDLTVPMKQIDTAPKRVSLPTGAVQRRHQSHNVGKKR